ncbi:MAG: hypothetical protein IPK05_16795 [Comamonadaceae bacterium]|nr:hypothetical protein [Comamonadaceae bacterium]
MRFEAHRIGGNDAITSDLRDRQVDEDDAALQHLRAQRHTWVASTSRLVASRAGSRMRQVDRGIRLSGNLQQALDGVIEEREQVPFACSLPPTW